MTHQIADQANLIELCIANLTFRPEAEQKGLIEALSKFVFCNEPRKAFVLNGFAGTGKTSVMAALIKSLASFNIKSVTLAPHRTRRESGIGIFRFSGFHHPSPYLPAHQPRTRKRELHTRSKPPHRHNIHH